MVSPDRARGHVAALARTLLAADWLTAGAFILTIGAFLGAVLDSYTSLCTVGAGIAHIGSLRDCPDVGGWDTRTFPLSIDMGWGGALLATVRLAHVLGLDNWRWWAVVVFEVLTAAFTVTGNALHALIADKVIVQGATATPQYLALAFAASAVPGVVAVGAGFTLNVLFSARHTPRRSGVDAGQSAGQSAGETGTQPPVQAPVAPPGLPPVSPPVQAPTEPPTQAPALTPTMPPVSAPDGAPGTSPALPSAEAPTTAPVESPAQAPELPPAEAPGEAPVLTLVGASSRRRSSDNANKALVRRLWRQYQRQGRLQELDGPLVQRRTGLSASRARELLAAVRQEEETSARTERNSR
jgi:hypothetical protein